MLHREPGEFVAQGIVFRGGKPRTIFREQPILKGQRIERRIACAAERREPCKLLEPPLDPRTKDLPCQRHGPYRLAETLPLQCPGEGVHFAKHFPRNIGDLLLAEPVARRKCLRCNAQLFAGGSIGIESRERGLQMGKA